MRHGFKRPKYNATRTEYNGVKYDSKREAEYACTLDMLKQAGEVVQWLRQIPFYLPGGVRYVCDFEVFWANGTVEFIDVKGMETATFKQKKKQVEALYAPITITVVK